MNYAYPFTAEELEAINTLPLEIRILADQYPLVFESYALDWKSPPLPPGTEVSDLEIYYGAELADFPDLSWVNGKSAARELRSDADRGIIQCLGSKGWLYIAIHGHRLINRWMDAVLPAALNGDADIDFINLLVQEIF